ncbi:MAG: YjjG family noncanonical pyrimidine nucleotidase [Oscillospiraceae bacterium]|nr:YjjG family noncanonical pyrimidine nucleotidase [Oscillospiraceae bacterium]
MIKAVFIDIDGTLLDFEACVEESMRVGLTENKIEYKPEMLETFHRINDVFWRDLEQGKITFEELLERRWATVFEALEIDLNGPEFETYFRKRLHESAIPMEGSYETLEYLSGKYRLFAASNGPHEQQIERLRKADMLKYFEDVFTSGKIGAEKPAKEFFEYCFEKAADIKPEESTMLGDSLTSDMKGGNDFGMKTIWLNLNGKEKPEWVDFEIKSLDEIKNII